MTMTFTTVITQEGKWFIANCVDLGVVSQGRSIDDAQKNLKEAVELYLEDAPKREMKLFSRRAPMVTMMQVSHG